LKGVEATATMTRPPSKSANTSRSANAPASVWRLVAALDGAPVVASVTWPISFSR